MSALLRVRSRIPLDRLSKTQVRSINCSSTVLASTTRSRPISHSPTLTLNPALKGRKGLATASDFHTPQSSQPPPPPTPPTSSSSNIQSHPNRSNMNPTAQSQNPFPPCPPIPKATGPVNLILPPTEDRPHKYFTLPNGMEVVVVSDFKADKAAASMDVGVGHLSDPDDLPGCAHFCEHLLFMGTKSFPKENEYSAYLSSHNGHSNAFTAMTSTVYFFDVGADALEGALDRFSGFFTEPLFNEDCTEREIKAVDSEHKKNILSDQWRFFQLEKHLSKPDHPYHKFGTGNYETLWSDPKKAGRDPRQQLISWWEKYYCARRMKLALVGKEDVETLEKWVRERFESVPVRSEGLPDVGPEGVRIAFEESPFGVAQMGTVTYTKPVRDQRGLEITFPFPDVDHLYGSKPGSYVSHFLGHEGRGSILSYLKRRGWVNQLHAGLSHCANGFDFIKTSVDLTPTGLDHYEEVALVILKYLNLLRSQPPSKVIFDEIKAINEISFRFAERSKASHYAMALSSMLQHPVPRDKIVSAGSLLEDYNEKELTAALQLLEPRNAILGVTSKEMPKGVEGVRDQKEPIYGTEYLQVPLSEKFLNEALSGTPLPDLHLPGQNLFIPEKLDVEKFDVAEPSLRPTLVKDTPLSRLWYKRDDQFWLPKANVDVMLHSPSLSVSPRHAVLARLFCDLYRDSITEDIYDADLAELSFSLWYSGDHIGIGAGGFSDKLAVLVETMLQRLVEFKVDEARFAGIADDLRQNWINFKLEDPFRQAAYWDSYIGAQDIWTQEEKLAELEHVTPEQVNAFGKEVIQRLYIETLIHGNTSPSGAEEIQNMLERVLHPRPLAEAEKNTERSLILPPSSQHVWSMEVQNKDEVNSGITYHVHICAPENFKLRASLQLFSQIAHEPTFDQLRTKEQLGYIVGGSSTAKTGALGYRIYIQSERDPVYLETRIEAFLDGMVKTLHDMNEEEFEKHKMSLIAKKEEKPKNLGEETRRFWASISDKYYEFGKRQTDIAQLRQITKSDIIDLFMTYIHPSSTTRSKLSVHMKSQYKGVKFDPNSAASLVEAFTKHNISVDQDALTKLVGGQPELSTVKEFAMNAVAKVADLAEEAKKEVQSLVEGLQGVTAGGADGAGQEVKLREGNVWIEDIHRFKAGLIPSKAAFALEPIKPVARL